MILRTAPGLISVLFLLGVGILLALAIRWWRRFRSDNLDAVFWAAHAGSARRLLKILLLPVAVDLAIRLALQPLASSVGAVLDIPFNIIRALLVAWSGWRVVRFGAASSLVASLAGPLFLFMDHVVVKGVDLLVGSSQNSRDRWPVFVGVLVSFLMFAPIAALLAWLGGITAGWRAKRNAVAA